MHAIIIGSGRIGNEINAAGVVEALGATHAMHRIAPRYLYAGLSPYGPVDPHDFDKLKREPFDIALASGRMTVPYLRAIKRARPDVFTVFLQDPRWARGEFDLIWAPEHDGLSGANVFTTLTSPHPFSPARLAAARAAPDPRVARLPAPRCAVSLGGSSGSQHFTRADILGLVEAFGAIRAQGYSLMVTPSRRTPAELATAARGAVGDGFFWEGGGDNPYPSMLALADALLVTGDSANMVGEAVATGAPVHVFEPTGGSSRKLGFSIDALVRRGAARRWAGRIESFSYAPIDSSAEIAAEVMRRYGERDRVRPAA